MYSSGHEPTIGIQILTSLTVGATPPLAGKGGAPRDEATRSGGSSSGGWIGIQGRGLCVACDNGATPRVGCVTRIETALDKRAAREESGMCPQRSGSSP